MKKYVPVLAVVLLVAGCASEPAPAPKAAAPAAAKSMPMMTDGVSDKECSHVLTEDTPAFTTMPGAQGVPPIGMIKAGTKVLAMVPGSMYTKCMMAGGKTVYVKTTSLKPTTN